MSEIKYINAGYEYIILREGKELGMSSETLRYIGKLEREIKRLNNIIKEFREYIENHSITNMEWWITGEQKIECKFMKDANPQELLEILDKGSDKE